MLICTLPNFLIQNGIHQKGVVRRHSNIVSFKIRFQRLHSRRRSSDPVADFLTVGRYFPSFFSRNKLEWGMGWMDSSNPGVSRAALVAGSGFLEDLEMR